MSDETLDKLGKYFVHLEIGKKYGISFERFVDMVKIGEWKTWQESGTR